MSCAKAKVELRPRDPKATLEVTMPLGENGYGTMVRTHKRMRVTRTMQVNLDYNEALVESDTGWFLQKVEDTTYQPKVLEQSGHFHVDVKGNVIGFCPNEDLSFSRVNELVRQLTAE